MVHRHKSLSRDLSVIVVSVGVAVWLAQSEFLANLILRTQSFVILETVVSGIFFTSIFTTAPAIVVLGEIAIHYSLLATAFFGALGALIGDLVLFMFIRDWITEDIMLFLNTSGLNRIRHIFQKGYLRRFSFLIAALVILSPLPDELGIAIFGAQKTRMSFFSFFAFAANFFGILIIGIIARALV